MPENSQIKLTIAFNDPDLDSEERDEQVQRLLDELRQMDEVEVDRVLDPNSPKGNKAFGGFLPGWLVAEVSVNNAKNLMGYLGDRLGNQPIELSVEGNGKKLSVKASSRAELEAAIKAAQDFIEYEQQQQAKDNQPITDPQSAASRPQPPTSRRSAQAPTPHSSPTITRQQFLKWTALSSGGLFVALVGHQVIQNQQTPENLESSELETVTVNDRGQIIDRAPVQTRFAEENLGNGVNLQIVAIPAGEFLMGAATDEQSASSDETPQHRVQLPTFGMGRFAVTQAQWSQVAGLPKVKIDLNADPSSFKGAKRPVELVSWDEAMEFCDRLSAKTGKPYRLPSEAEWEYACRAGTTTPFHFGATITSDLVNCYGNYPYANAPKGEYRQQTTEVGAFPPNGFGLYDMHGNVSEWCADQWYGSYANKPEQLKQNGAIAWTEETTGMAPKSDETNYRLLRGGSWLNYPRHCRSAIRGREGRVNRDNLFGFRVVCSVSRT